MLAEMEAANWKRWFPNRPGNSVCIEDETFSIIEGHTLKSLVKRETPITLHGFAAVVVLHASADLIPTDLLFMDSYMTTTGSWLLPRLVRPLRVPLTKSSLSVKFGCKLFLSSLGRASFRFGL